MCRWAYCCVTDLAHSWVISHVYPANEENMHVITDWDLQLTCWCGAKEVITEGIRVVTHEESTQC